MGTVINCLLSPSIWPTHGDSHQLFIITGNLANLWGQSSIVYYHRQFVQPMGTVINCYALETILIDKKQTIHCIKWVVCSSEALYDCFLKHAQKYLHNYIKSIQYNALNLHFKVLFIAIYKFMQERLILLHIRNKYIHPPYCLALEASVNRQPVLNNRVSIKLHAI